MSQKNRPYAVSLAIFLCLASAALYPAHAWPLDKLLHLHFKTVEPQNACITVQLYNNSGLVQQVKIAGQVYTLLPHDGLTIKAPEGTEVFAASNGFKHRKGDLLFAVTSKLNLDTVKLD
jgi:hypothetical protein